MPERSFGRTVRYRRTQLGLSQAKLGELVGRSTATIRAWERGSSRPTDPKVLTALSAILGVDERHLFDKVDVEHPEIETSPTVEQALATLTPEVDVPVGDDDGDDSTAATESRSSDHDTDKESLVPGPDVDRSDPSPERERERELIAATAGGPAYAEPSDPYVQTPVTPPLVDQSYVEDSSQRQVYRVRTLATLVAVVALVIALVWAVSEGVGALGEWWDELFGMLQI